jgi:hypothetical protein
MGPKREVAGELTRAIRKHGLIPGVSNHRAEHWWFFDGGRSFLLMKCSIFCPVMATGCTTMLVVRTWETGQGLNDGLKMHRQLG